MRGLRDSAHGENPGVVGVKDLWRYPKFCVNGRGSKCKPKSYVIEMRTHCQVIT